MTTPDVPAERGRGELHERLLAIIESRRMEPWTDTGRPCCVMCGSRWDGEHKAECWVPTLREAAALLAPQEAPICLQCIERAEQEIAAGHYYRADELMAALRERREPVCACGETHLDRTPLAAARPAPETRTDEASWVEYDHGDPVRALAAVREIILDAHCNRSTNETDAFYDRWLVETVSGPFDSIPAMLRDHLEGLEAARIATEPSAPDGATWGDVRSGLRAELIAEGMPVTEATRLARKVVHRFTAAEATERSES